MQPIHDSEIVPDSHKMYFLHPYDLHFNIRFYKETVDNRRTIEKNEYLCSGSQAVQLRFGPRELNTYLILGQVYFKFLNDINDMNAEIDPKLKQSLDQTRKMNQLKNQKQPDKKEEEAPQTLDQVLKNEGLLESDIKDSVRKFQRGVIKAITMTQTQRIDFLETIYALDFPGVQLTFEDMEYQPLVTFSIKNYMMIWESRQYFNMNPVQMEQWWQTDKVMQEFDSFETQFNLEGTYYNHSTYTDESFIEPFALNFSIKQKSPTSDSIQLMESKDMLNINLTYNLARNLQVVIRNILELEKEELDKQNQSLNDNNEEYKQSSIEEGNRRQPHGQKHQYSLNLNPLRRQQQNSPGKIFNIQGENQVNEDLYSINSSEQEFPEVKEVFFINNTGVEIKFCLSIFGDLLTQFNQQQAQTEHIYTLGCDDNSNRNIIPIENFEEMLEKFQDISYGEQKTSMRMDFVIKGFQKIENVILQKNGVFGYYLFKEGKKRKGLFGVTETSKHSCIVRINRRKEDIQVFFESSLVIFNDIDSDLSFYAFAHNTHTAPPPEGQLSNDLIIKQKDIHNPPLTWFINKSSLYCNINLNFITTVVDFEPNVENMLVFQDISKVCDPRVIDPYTDHSKVLTINRRHVAVDIFLLKTKTNVGQFLIVFKPVLQLQNLLFTDIRILGPRWENPEFNFNIKTNRSLNIYDINPYSKQSTFTLQYRETESEIFEKNNIAIDLKNLEGNQAIGIQEGFFVRLVNRNWLDQSRPGTIPVAFELQKDTHQLKETKYDNFLLRNKIYGRTKSVGFAIYAPYIAINQTNVQLILLGLETRVIKLLPLTSLYVKPLDSRMQLQLDNYHRSDYFDISTLGVSGSLRFMQKRGKRRIGPEYGNIMDPSLNPDGQDILEIGTYITMCSHPYTKTKIIKFLPRYVLVNKLDLPIVIREKTSPHQIALTPGEEIYYNMGQRNSNQMLIRMLNFEEEAKVVVRTHQPAIIYQANEELQTQIQTVQRTTIQSQPFETRREEYLISNSNENPEEQIHVKKQEYREHQNPEEYSGNILGQMTEQMVIQLSPAYAQTRELQIWSYKFPLNNIDDFQITLPNPN